MIKQQGPSGTHDISAGFLKPLRGGRIAAAS